MNKLFNFFYNENIKNIISQNALNNRELAYLIIILILFVFLFVITFKKDKNGIINSFKKLLESFFKLKIFTTISLTFLWICLSTYILKKVELWNYGLIKNTFIWFITSGVFIIFKAGLIKQYDARNYIKYIIINSFKITVFFEFLQSTYVFNLWIELLIGVIILFLGLMKSVIEISKNIRYETVLKFINKFIKLIVILLLLSLCYNLMTNYKELFEINNVLGFVDNIILSISMIIPTYILRLYIDYENLFIRLKICNENISMQKHIKFKIILYAKLNIEKLNLKYYNDIFRLSTKEDIDKAFEELKKSIELEPSI